MMWIHDFFQGIFNHCWMGAVVHILLLTPEFVDEFCEMFWDVGCLTSNKPFDSGADLVYCLGPGIL